MDRGIENVRPTTLRLASTCSSAALHRQTLQDVVLGTWGLPNRHTLLVQTYIQRQTLRDVLLGTWGLPNRRTLWV